MFADPAAITVIDARFNRLRSLSASLAKFRNLRALRLSYNQLEEVPDELGALTNLKFLHLSSNPLRRFPPILRSMPQLEVLYLDQVGIEEIPVRFQPASLVRLSVGRNVGRHSRSDFSQGQPTALS